MKKIIKRFIIAFVVALMTMSPLVSMPSQANATNASTVFLQVYDGDGYISLWVRYHDYLPSDWGWQDLERACGGKVLIPGTLQVNITDSSSQITQVSPDTTQSTVRVTVQPGDGYWAVFEKNRSVFPTSWGWQDLERACGGKMLMPGTMQVRIDGETQSTSGTKTERIIGTCTMSNWCDADSWHNIVTSAEQLNGIVIPSGSYFNWFQHVGYCTGEPYVEAPVQPEGTAYGGGICFTSTVLYQAACLSAGMKEEVRCNHQYKVWYAELGKDAAINYDNKNQIWWNNSDSDIRIDTFVNRRELTVNIVALG